MDLDDIRALYSFNRWANRRVLEASRSLDRAALLADLGVSHRSIRGTLVHALWAEWVWLRRWLGTSPRAMFGEDEYPDLPAIESAWAEVERERDDFIAGLDPDRLRADLTYVNLRGERWTYPLVDMMQHVANHSSFHRGQVVALLRRSGLAPPATDFLVWRDEGGR